MSNNPASFKLEIDDVLEESKEVAQNAISEINQQIQLVGGRTINAGTFVVYFMSIFTLELAYQRQNILRSQLPKNP